MDGGRIACFALNVTLCDTEKDEIWDMRFGYGRRIYCDIFLITAVRRLCYEVYYRRQCEKISCSALRIFGSQHVARVCLACPGYACSGLVSHGSLRALNMHGLVGVFHIL